MEGLGDLLKKRVPAANKRLHSEMHLLADEMSTYFNERKKFGMYLGVIKRLGLAKARSIFADIKSDRAQVRSPQKLFMWFSRQKPDTDGLAGRRET